MFWRGEYEGALLSVAVLMQLVEGAIGLWNAKLRRHVLLYDHLSRFLSERRMAVKHAQSKFALRLRNSGR